MATTTAPQSQMIDEVLTMYLLIKGRGISGFRMMGAEHIVYDNEKLMLQWKMGEGSHVDKIQFFYDYDRDLYRLRFINYGPDYSIITKDETVENVYTEDVVRIIENRTGFFLSL